MTKSRQSGHSVHTDAAKREAIRTGRSVCDILAEWLTQAKRAGKQRLETKQYVVQDYDLLNFRFNK